MIGFPMAVILFACSILYGMRADHSNVKYIAAGWALLAIASFIMALVALSGAVASYG